MKTEQNSNITIREKLQQTITLTKTENDASTMLRDKGIQNFSFCFLNERKKKEEEKKRILKQRKKPNKTQQHEYINVEVIHSHGSKYQ